MLFKNNTKSLCNIITESRLNKIKDSLYYSPSKNCIQSSMLDSNGIMKNLIIILSDNMKLGKIEEDIKIA